MTREQLIEDALRGLLPYLQNLNWRKGTEGDGYLQSNAVYSAQIHYDRNFESYKEALSRCELALKGQTPEEVELEKAQAVVANAEAALQKAQEKLAELKKRRDALVEEQKYVQRQ